MQKARLRLRAVRRGRGRGVRVKLKCEVQKVKDYTIAEHGRKVARLSAFKVWVW